MASTYQGKDNWGPNFPQVDQTTNAQPTQPADPDAVPQQITVANQAREQRIQRIKAQYPDRKIVEIEEIDHWKGLPNTAIGPAKRRGTIPKDRYGYLITFEKEQ